MNNVVCNLFLSYFAFLPRLSLGFSSCETCGEAFTFIRNKTTIDHYSLEGFSLDRILVSSDVACFSACIEKDCKCMSFNFNVTANKDGLYDCQLNYEDKKTLPSALKRRRGYRYYDIVTEEYPVGKSCRSKPCKNNCCMYSPCSNNGNCTEVCDSIRRFRCQCPPGYSGRFCKKAKSCIDYLRYNITLPSGEYTVFDVNDSRYTVYCHMDIGNLRAWTLVVSFSYMNNDQFKFHPLHQNFGVSNTIPNWSAYRLSFSQMMYLQTQTSFWKATCNYNLISGDLLKDYVISRFQVTDIMVGETDMSNATCSLVDSVNIRGYKCNNCTLRLVRVDSYFTYVGVHDTEYLGCSLVLDKKTTSIGHEQAFGVYENVNPQFSCTESSSSTTQWWMGETLVKENESVKDVSVFIRSEGCEDQGVTDCGQAYIKVNGVDYAPKNRGHNVVVIKPSGIVLQTAAFDTHGDLTSGHRMNQFLLDIPYGSVVLIAVMDSAEQFTSDAMEGLRWVGADITDLGDRYRESWLLIGYKGAKKAWIYQDGNARYKGPTQVSKTIAIPYSEY